MIKRKHLLNELKESFKNHKITALIGPRQVGKTTLAKDFIKLTKKMEIHFFDLEDPTDFDLLENAKLTLGHLEGLIVIDEVQRRPELFKYLRVKADTMLKTSKIILLGSSSRDLLEQASESLAGRIRYIEVVGFSTEEVKNHPQQFLRGSFPLSYTAKTEMESYQWRKSYVQAYIERDLKTLGIDLPPQGLRRLLEMLAGYHGQIFNSSEIGKSLGFSHTTARKYLDILTSTFLIRELRPWYQSIIQRQVKQPKIYFRDSGLANYFLNIKSQEELLRNPRLGSLWEGFALEETIKLLGAETEDLYFWALHQEGELDLLWKRGPDSVGFEFKYADVPKVTSSMMKAIELLKINHLYIIYPGTQKAKLAEKVTLLPFGKNYSEYAALGMG
ncbi:MAG: ATP-binding protein [Pseudomonadota bacterium]